MRPGMTIILLALITGLAAACGPARLASGPAADAQGHTPATAITAKANSKVRQNLPLDDRQSFQDARRGLIARHPNLKITGQKENPIWDQTAYDFIQGQAPASVNPSLWRQAALNHIQGLFRVTQGIYQLRGFDLSNMTIIEGRTGWIIVDPLTARETAAEALAFAREHLEAQPISAIIFTHSHVDHFGGVLGIINPDQVRKKDIEIYAPQDFMQEATSENILAGMAMGRRAAYMYGKRLARSKRGHVGSGLGKGPAFGQIGILRPTVQIDKTPQPLTIDGVRFVFQYAPESEAPAELTFYLPDRKAYCGAEIVSQTMHNLYTLRGAKVRDALKWSGYIEEARQLFGDKMEVYFGSHHWPVWGHERVMNFLKTQRDTYKYIHDQTLRLSNQGHTPREIAEQLRFPETLRTHFSNRGYYGTLRHNAKAVYQAYFGWYDGNPANLDPLPPVKAGRRYVQMMGGAATILPRAQDWFEKGEYRWTAQLLNHLVMAQPDHRAARALLAKTYDQLGYQAESGPWRDVYLTAAYELRHGGPEEGLDLSDALELLRQTPLSRFFDSMAARLNGPKANGINLAINLIFTDLDQSFVLWIENAVLHHRQTDPDPEAEVTIQLTHDLFLEMAIGKVGFKETFLSEDFQVDGSLMAFMRFFRLFDKPSGRFNIVVP